MDGSMTDLEVPDSLNELARLRAENEELRAQLARHAPADHMPRRRRRVGRWTFATVFLVIGCLLLPISAVALWARTILFDTDRYVATVAPLARDPAVQDAVADRITVEVFAALDIAGFTSRAIDTLVKQGAPPELATLRQPIVNGVQSFVHTQVRNVVGTEAFAQAWEQANRTAHAGLVDALKGNEGGTIEVKNGTVSVSVGAFIETIKPQLVAAGVPLADKIPAINVSFPIVSSDQIPRIQRAASLLDTLALPLVVLALLLLAAAVWIAPNRRRMLAFAGLGMAFALLALLGVLAAGRSYYLNHLPPNTIPPDAAAVVWDTLTRQFTARLEAIVVLGLVIAISAGLVGPGQLARELRKGASWLIISARVGARRLGWRPGATDRWAAAHVGALRAAAVVLIIFVYVLWTRPSGAVIIWLALTLLALITAIELVRRGTDLPAEPDGSSPAAGPESPSSALSPDQGAAPAGT
jgi:hypothetical protein